MSATFERKPRARDEVSAIELAAICVKRRVLLFAVFFCFLVGSLGYVLMVDRHYKFQSLYSLTSWGDDRYVVGPDSMVALVNGKIWPEIKALHEADGSQPLLFDVSINKISGTSLLEITSVAEEESAADIERIHKELMRTVRQYESAKEEDIKNSLKERISEFEAYAAKISEGNVGGNEVAPVYEQLIESRRQLDSFSPGGVQALALRGGRPVGPSRALLLLAGLMIGLISGVFSTFVAEFFSRVRGHLIDSTEL